uniref:Uncharacterized protein n=1 Tax=Heterorhabditis bacteriophora TaxID=37862 RepID=A0A1I7WZN4_HETBA
MLSVVLLLIFVYNTKQQSSLPCKTFDGFGLCPFQSMSSDVVQLAINASSSDENCLDSKKKILFIPCLLNSGFSCIRVHINNNLSLSGCIRDDGYNPVFFEYSKNLAVIEIRQINEFALTRPCSLLPTPCALSEVSLPFLNRSTVLRICCCKGNECAYPQNILSLEKLTKNIQIHIIYLFL